MLENVESFILDNQGVLAMVLEMENGAAEEQQHYSYLNRKHHAGQLNSNLRRYRLVPD